MAVLFLCLGTAFSPDGANTAYFCVMPKVCVHQPFADYDELMVVYRLQTDYKSVTVSPNLNALNLQTLIAESVV